MNDGYKILGTARDADEAQIKAAYRKLAKKYHPDAHPGDKECEARFREITEAYTILSDPAKRKKYDEEFSSQAGQQKTNGGKSGGMGRETRQGTKASSGNEGAKVDFENISRNFEQFFGFNPQTKDVVNPEKLKSRANAGNPLDTTNLFEAFMGIKR